MLKNWFMATRPWSYTAAAVPIGLGNVLAWNAGYFDFTLFILTLLGCIAIQAGTNMINTYGDYRSGVDTLESAVTCPQLVNGTIKPETMKMVGIAAFSIAFAIGLYLSWLRGWEILLIGLIGVVGGYTYTAGPLPYKYQGLGSVFVFFLMGPMMVWPAWFVQTGQYSWIPVLASLPIGFLVAAILNGNDVRDFKNDLAAGIKTLPLLIGWKSGLLLQRYLYTGAYASLFILIPLQVLPPLALAPIALIPLVRRVFLMIDDAIAGNTGPLITLESMAAGFHFQFGLLMCLGLLLNPLFGRGF